MTDCTAEALVAPRKRTAAYVAPRRLIRSFLLYLPAIGRAIKFSSALIQVTVAL
jgi:hypothetical protein